MRQTQFDETLQLGLLQTHLPGVFVFSGQRRVEHGRVVGGEHDGNAVTKELAGGGPRWLQSPCRANALARRCRDCLPGKFLGESAFREQVHQRGIVDGSDAVADAFDAKKLDRFADFFGAADFSGVD